MRKKMLSIALMVALVASVAGCGNSNEEKTVTSTKTEYDASETVENEPVAETEEVVEMETAGEEKEALHNADDYEEQKDIFMVKHIDIGDGTEIDFTNEEIIDGPFVLPESIDIYSFFFTYAGYTKPNIKISSVGKVDDWIVVPFAQSSFLVKAEDFDRVAVLKAKTENTIKEDDTKTEVESASVKQEVSATQNTGSSSTASEIVPAPTAEPQKEVPAPVVTTYSEAEVISIVEGALRDAGFRKPEEKMTAEELAMFGPTAGMGWGIENISMTDPYGDAAGTVEGFQFAGWTTYYIESQGSSDGYVHLKLYSGT
ncbi:MAG: hypothetical protein NC489_42760 [Ruminococcus flavefaciens]|nr:hypothetical protein [Ruminococcus flavefaciens]